MGDRTTLFLEILKSDRDAVTKLFGDPAEEHPSNAGPAAELLVFGQVNYGGGDLLAELAQLGIPLRARHEEGDEYGGATFAACDGTLADVSSPRGDVMVRFDTRTLEPCTEEMAALRRWRDTDDRVRAILAASPRSNS